MAAAAALPGGAVGISRLEAVLVYVRSLERSVPFYKRVFDLQLVAQEPQAALLQTRDAGTLLALREMSNAPTPPT